MAADPGVRRGRWRWPTVVAAVVTAFVVGLAATSGLLVLLARTRHAPARPAGQGDAVYCLEFGHPDRTEAEIRRAIAGHPYRSLDLAALRGSLDFFRGPNVVRGAPDAQRADAQLVVAAERRAIRLGRVAPLDRPEVRAAYVRLQAAAARACPPSVLRGE